MDEIWVNFNMYQCIFQIIKIKDLIAHLESLLLSSFICSFFLVSIAFRLRKGAVWDTFFSSSCMQKYELKNWPALRVNVGWMHCIIPPQVGQNLSIRGLTLRITSYLISVKIMDLRGHFAANTSWECNIPRPTRMHHHRIHRTAGITLHNNSLAENAH